MEYIITSFKNNEQIIHSVCYAVYYKKTNSNQLGKKNTCKYIQHHEALKEMNQV